MLNLSDISIKILKIYSILGPLLFLLWYCQKQSKKRDRQVIEKPMRPLSLYDLPILFLYEMVFSFFLFLLIMVIYAQIVINLGWIDDGLRAFNDYISLVPIKIDEGYDQYSIPIVLLRPLPKYPLPREIWGALFITESIAWGASTLVLRDTLTNYSPLKHGGITGIFTLIIWFLVPYSLVFYIISHSGLNMVIVYVRRLLIKTHPFEEEE